jgi:hypothetical protein
MRSMRRALLFALACVALLVPPRAQADNPDSVVKRDGGGSPGATAELDTPNERRGGLVIGLFLGAGLASSAGYPNDENFIGNPDYYSASGLMYGSGGSLFVMGALTDYLSFGFWFGSATFENPSWHSRGEGGGLRLELFPLYGVGGILRDLGVFTQVGIGGTELDYTLKPGVSSDGVSSFLGAGVFYEWKLFKALGGHFAMGPSLEYDAIYSEPIERHGALLGVRFLWYGGK